MTYRIGDLIKIWLGYCWHYGVVTTAGEVVWVLDMRAGERPRLRTLEEFEGDHEVVVEEPGSPGHALSVALRATEVLERRRPYHLLIWNCEHLARYVATGKVESQQVNDGATWLVKTAFQACLPAPTSTRRRLRARALRLDLPPALDLPRRHARFR